MSRFALLALAVLPFAVACDKNTDEPGDSDGNMPYCEDVETAMSPEDASSFGLSGQQFLDSIPAQMQGDAAFADGADAGLSVLVSVDAASLRSVASEAVYPETSGPVPDIAVICPDRVEVDAQVQIRSEDGRLAETLSVVLSSEDPAELGGALGEVLFSAELDHENLEGSLDMADFADLSSFDDVSLHLTASILDGAFLGELAGVGEATDGQTGSAEFIPVAELDAAAAVE